MGRPRKPDPVKRCRVCGVLMTRKRFNGTLEDMTRFMSRQTCGQSCGNTKAEPTSRDAYHWRARQNRGTHCAECGTTERLHVHHMDRNPKNNEPSNLATLCGSCHLKLHWREDPTRRVARRGASSVRP